MTQTGPLVAESEADEKDGWRAVLDIGWRPILVFAGIPAVWILRANDVVHLSIWQAVVASVVLLAIAAGDALLALTIST